MSGIPDAGIVTVAIGRPDIACVVLPRARADNVRWAVRANPRRTVCRGALVSLVPAVLYPLIDTTTHVIEPKWIRLEIANLDGLVADRDVGAILAVGHAGLQLVAPPVFRLRSSARGIFPFGFAWEPVGLSGSVREPGDIY